MVRNVSFLMLVRFISVFPLAQGQPARLAPDSGHDDVALSLMTTPFQALNF